MFLLFFEVLLLFYQSDAKQERQYLNYKFTVLTKADTFPEFMAEAESDDKLIAHYSNKERVWIRENLTDWTKAPGEPSETRDWYLDQLHALSKCTTSANCSELHVLQRIVGCELEKLPDGTVTHPTVFDEYGFDGNYLMAFNPDTMKWIDKSSNSRETKVKWDRQTERNKRLKDFLENCTDWISTFNNTIKSSPDVRVSVSKSPDDDSKLVLICLATGFYPRDVQMNIRLNRINLEDQTSSGIRPNHDETFQMKISVKIHRNHEGSYDCLLTHSSLTEPVSVNWDGKCSNCEPESLWPVIAGVIAGVVVVGVVLALIGIYWYINKQRSSNGQVINSSSYGAVNDQIQITHS